jgi:hypothetical protein
LPLFLLLLVFFLRVSSLVALFVEGFTLKEIIIRRADQQPRNLPSELVSQSLFGMSADMSEQTTYQDQPTNP